MTDRGQARSEVQSDLFGEPNAETIYWNGLVFELRASGDGNWQATCRLSGEAGGHPAPRAAGFLGEHPTYDAAKAAVCRHSWRVHAGNYAAVGGA